MVRWTLLSVMALVLLAGCGAAAPATPLALLETTAEHRVIRHAFGETNVPLRPQRLLAIGEEGLLADLLDAGVRPVAASVNVPEQVALIGAAELAGIALFPSAAEVSVEALATSQPDLIIGASFFVEQIGYRRLVALAPTVVLGASGPLESYVETLTILSRAAEAQRTVDAFRAEVKAAGEPLAAPSRRVTATTVYPGPSVALWFDGPSPIPLLLRELGVQLVPAQAARANLSIQNGRAFISLEQLPLLQDETLLLLQSSGVAGEADATGDVQANPLWPQVPAVQAGRVTTLDRLGSPGLRGQRALLADLVRVLAP